MNFVALDADHQQSEPDANTDAEYDARVEGGHIDGECNEGDINTDAALTTPSSSPTPTTESAPANRSGKSHRSAPKLPPSAQHDTGHPTHSVHRPPPATAPSTPPRSDIFDFVPMVTPRPKPTPPGSARSAPSSASSASSVVHRPDSYSSDEDTRKKPSHPNRIARRDSFRYMNTKQMQKKHSLTRGSSSSFHETLYDKTVVIDQGSYYMRSGFAGEEGPISHFRNVVCPKQTSGVCIHLSSEKVSYDGIYFDLGT
jgi:hypothetical protein